MVFFRSFAISLTALAITISAAGFFGWQNHRLARDFAETRATLEVRYQDADRKLESYEERLAQLRDRGFIEQETFSDFAARVSASTVRIGKRGGDDNFLGTGFFITTDGVLATARHVVDTIGSHELLVQLPSGEEFPAELVALGKKGTDISVIRIAKAGTPAVDLGYFENLAVGDEVGFVGFTEAYVAPLVHRGIVSAMGTGQDGARFFTVNAFVNRGNSGGPVFSAETGRVVGVISARQRDIPEEKLIPTENISSGFSVGGIDPLKVSIALYNETLRTVGDISQVGIGIIDSTDWILEFLRQR